MNNMVCDVRGRVSMVTHGSIAFGIAYVGERSHRAVGDRSTEDVLLGCLVAECLGRYTCTYIDGKLAGIHDAISGTDTATVPICDARANRRRCTRVVHERPFGCTRT